MASKTTEVVSLLPFTAYFTLVFSFSTISLLPLQVIAGVWNLIRQRTQFFYRLKVAETMRAFMAHNMDGSDDLRARLETKKSEVVATRKLVEEGIGLLRRAEEENEAAQAETCWLAEEKEEMEVGKKNTEEEAGQLRQELQELQELWTGFVL